MNKDRVNEFRLTNRNCFSDADIPIIIGHLEAIDDSKWPLLSAIKLKDPQIALMLSIFGGPIGFDRFYIGDNVLGVLKTITCGGLLIWAIIDLFLIRNSTQSHNLSILIQATRY